MMGPAGRVKVSVAMFPDRAKSNGWKSSNHSVTSDGGELVKKRPTWPFICWMEV